MCEVDATCACHVRAYRVPQDVFAASSQSPQPSVHKHAIDAPSLNSFLIVYLYGTQTPGHAESLNSLSHVYTSTSIVRLWHQHDASHRHSPSTCPPRATPRISAGTCAPIIGLSRARAHGKRSVSGGSDCGRHARREPLQTLSIAPESSKRARTWQATRLIRIGRRIGLNLLSGRRQARKKERTWPDPRSSMRLRMRRGCSGR
jgi:hypothetical protein